MILLKETGVCLINDTHISVLLHKKVVLSEVIEGFYGNILRTMVENHATLCDYLFRSDDKKKNLIECIVSLQQK